MLIKPKKSTGLLLRVSSVLAALAIALAFGAYLKASSGGGRVVVLGFDGADFRLVTQGIADGKLPNLQRLAESGGFVPLTPTIPAQTPVSWSTFSTGISPGRTQIFDFLKRDPKTYRPEFAVADEGKKAFLFGERNSLFVPLILAGAGALLGLLGAALFRAGGKVLLATAATLAVIGAAFGVKAASLVPKTVPTVHNNRQGIPFWEAAGKRGVKAVVLHVPVTFPADDFPEGRLLAGLGVPDVRGRIGTPSFYTSDPFFAPKNSNEFSVELVRLDANKGTIKTEVVGPYNKLFAEPPVVKTPMTLSVAPDGKRLSIAPEGSTPITLGVGEWSPWVTFHFKFNSLVKLSAIGRFHLASLSPEVQLYLSPLQFDPSALPPQVKISAPASFAKSLWKKFGL
ncbi:MAG TPA: alkaline phosphatase family protein, partial [Thermoanaerobaculia bacterium]|nr:alkaline phosphatase family protein [Thermoanaerobaculia bacterium]